MTGQRNFWSRQLVPSGILTPRGMLQRALGIVAVFAICHLVGWREYTTIISGTSPTGNPANFWSIVPGCIYAVIYFAMVIAMPILVIAAGLLFVAEKWLDRSRSPS